VDIGNPFPRMAQAFLAGPNAGDCANLIGPIDLAT
jgi:hypothetical protein